MVEYPKEFELDGIYIRVNRDGKYCNRCFTDLTKDEQKAYLGDLNERALERMCLTLADELRGFGEFVIETDAARKKEVMCVSTTRTPCFTIDRKSKRRRTETVADANAYPFGYNPDGTPNEREREVVRFVFAKHQEYFFNPPQELIEEAYAWAKSEGMTLNEEEAQDMARVRLTDFIAREVQQTFPDVKYREPAPRACACRIEKRYPARPFKDEPLIDPALFAQVQDIMSRG